MKAAFLDRDGIINVDKGYVYRRSDFTYQIGIIRFLKSLKKKGFKLFIITNQSGIARGMYSSTDVKKLHDWLQKDLSKYSIIIEHIEYCPHLPSDNCNCRKPKIGMIEKILRKYPEIELNKSILLGDKESDFECGQNAGIKLNYHIKTNNSDINRQFLQILNNL